MVNLVVIIPYHMLKMVTVSQVHFSNCTCISTATTSLYNNYYVS